MSSTLKVFAHKPKWQNGIMHRADIFLRTTEFSLWVVLVESGINRVLKISPQMTMTAAGTFIAICPIVVSTFLCLCSQSFSKTYGNLDQSGGPTDWQTLIAIHRYIQPVWLIMWSELFTEQFHICIIHVFNLVSCVYILCWQYYLLSSDLWTTYSVVE